MNLGAAPPSWRLPEGVNPSLWEYAHSGRLADDEDAYFSGHPLFAEDARLLAGRFVEPAPLVDLGCGAGRLSIAFSRRGFPTTAVDLSRPMLAAVAAKARSAGVSVDLAEANLCRLGFRDASFAYALSMFSTLGMIRGAASRRRALSEAARVLRPGGRLALHAHNVWLNLRDPQGRAWLTGQLLAALTGRAVFGDRRMTYRGVANMEVHLFTWRELRRDLASAGFLLDEVIPIDEVTSRPIRLAWLAHGIRAGGWIVFARKPATPGEFGEP